MRRDFSHLWKHLYKLSISLAIIMSECYVLCVFSAEISFVNKIHLRSLFF